MVWPRHGPLSACNHGQPKILLVPDSFTSHDGEHSCDLSSEAEGYDRQICVLYSISGRAISSDENESSTAFQTVDG